MKTFSYKDQLYTCEVIKKNTNPVAKSKCVRIITQNGVRNIYTIANGYTQAIAYDKNKIILSDIVIGKAFAILGLMQNGKKFVFSNNTDTEVITPTSSTIVAITNTSSSNTMFRVMDTTTGSIAMFSSEIDVVSYCIGKTVKVDKVEISTSIATPNIIPIIESTAPEIECIPIVDTNTPKRRKGSDYTVPKTIATPDVPIDIPIPSTDETPKRRKKVS